MSDSVINDHYIHNILTRKRVTDELHIGGKFATAHLLAALDLKPGQHVLDVGSGLGAAARLAADTYDVRVTGIDLVQGFVAEAVKNTDDARVNFSCGSALAMDFSDSAFDASFMLHVNMNIEEKQKLFREIARVLRAGSLFGFYEIMADVHAAAMVYPCPWAMKGTDSFLATPGEIETMLEVAGFAVIEKEDRRDFALEAMERRQADYPEQAFVNLLENVRAMRCVPWQYVCRKL